MTLDLISMAILASSAVLAITAISNLLGTTSREKLWARTLLSAWFAGVLAIGATHLIVGGGPLRTAGLGLMVMLPVVVLCIATFSSSKRRAQVERADLPSLVSIQSMRVEGIIFVLLYAAHRLSAPFAPVAGWGDTLVGLLAIPLSLALADRRTLRFPLAAWTILGMLDLITAVTLGTLSAPTPFQVFRTGPSSAIMSTLPWILIPAFMVPCYFFLHIVVIARMRSGTVLTSTPRPSRSLEPELI